MKCPICGNELRIERSPLFSPEKGGFETHHCETCCRTVSGNECRFKLIESEGVLLQVTTGKRFPLKTRRVDSKQIIGGRFVGQN